MTTPTYATTTPSSTQDVAAVAPFLAMLMLRNVTTDGWEVQDPTSPDRRSRPGCVLASPSYPADTPDLDQNYVYHWTRDAALVALEVAAGSEPVLSLGAADHLSDWLAFGEATQTEGTAPLDRGCWRIDATARDWSNQSDGPALRVLAALAALPLVGAEAAACADRVIRRDLDFLLDAYPATTTDLWEERVGHSIFTRAVQLRALATVADTSYAAAYGARLTDAVTALRAALEEHWDADAGVFRCLLDGGDVGHRDPAIDVVLAAVVGALDPTDPRVLATAARLRGQWADPTSPLAYPINADDDVRGIGPLVGRYPDDTYDGDVGDGYTTVGHPWPLCTAAFATLYYRVAAAADLSALLTEPLARPLFEQLDVGPDTPPIEAATLLRAAGDRMLRAVLFHSDHLELSEQLDARTGFQKSVRNLTWSYAAYLAALRER